MLLRGPKGNTGSLDDWLECLAEVPFHTERHSAQHCQSGVEARGGLVGRCSRVGARKHAYHFGPKPGRDPGSVCPAHGYDGNRNAFLRWQSQMGFDDV